ncbi:YkgJ family cysteine cluster protein [Mongoliitalea daihaiensis]|uniref:YkgJ family cysteine cluster protein n=1 Tax=Mongoliitalea daihaiensis TaxID=2782006 RepID=UPI001F33B419|nr:YkgJ family cysteine cluster protein [Mongoliitalea daihaiensis]UJP65763.1 YkgJ family cysteine cluster protein [Mongoliitalea daihaiensis]
MNLREKSTEVRRVFDQLDQEVKAFMDVSQLTCISGCGKCCSNPKVSATVMEFIPLAFDLYDKGKAEAALDLLDSKTEDDWCIVYKSLSEDGAMGFCSDYHNRGMICRLFSSSHRTNKHGQKEIITCKKIKTEKQSAFELTAQAVNQGLEIPSSSGYYAQLFTIDQGLTADQFPINQAIRKAIEHVLTYQFYTENQEPEATDCF